MISMGHSFLSELVRGHFPVSVFEKAERVFRGRVRFLCVRFLCGGILLSQESFYFQSSNAYPAFFIGWAAVILLPVLSIGITIVLFCLDRELSAESCAVSRRISELETRLEKLTRLSR